MYQGVLTQCHGVAHKSRFSDFPQSAESFLFTFQYFAPMGHYFHPNSHAFQWSAPMGHLFIPILMLLYSTTFMLLNTRHLPSCIFSMGHSSFPFLAAFIAHYISHYYGVYQFTRGTFPSRFIMGYLFFPFNNSSGLMGHLSFP